MPISDLIKILHAMAITKKSKRCYNSLLSAITGSFICNKTPMIIINRNFPHHTVERRAALSMDMCNNVMWFFCRVSLGSDTYREHARA